MTTVIGNSTKSTYDAFISYSHAQDAIVAEALQRELRRFAVPWYRHRPALPGFRPPGRRFRPLRVFRDTTNLSASPELWTDIEQALASSEWFILMASPAAARSEWVREEVSWWFANRPASRMLIALTDGDLAWKGDDFDWTRSNAAPPELSRAFASAPLWIDLTALRPDASTKAKLKLGDLVAGLAGPVRGVPKDELVGEHLRQRRRARSTSVAAVASLASISVLATVNAVRANSAAAQARAQTRVALSRQLAAESLVASSATPGIAARLAEAAWSESPTTQAGAAMTSLLDYQVHSGMVVASVFAISSVAYSPDGKILASGDLSGQVQLRDIATQLPVTGPIQLVHGEYSQVTSLAFSPDGKTLAVAGSDGAVHFLDPATGRPARPALTVADADSIVYAVAYSPDGRALATADQHGMIKLWDASPGNRPPTVQISLGGQASAYSLGFSPDGATIAAGTNEGTVRMWATTTASARGRSMAVTGDPDDLVESIAFSPDGRTVFAAEADGTARLWDVHSGVMTVLIHAATAPGTEVRTVAFSPDGRAVAAGGTDGKLRLWDSRTGAAIAPHLGSSPGAASVFAIAFSPDGRVLAAGDADGVIRVRNVATGDPVGAPTALSAALAGPMAFGSNGAIVAIADDDGNARLWNTADGRPVAAPFNIGGRQDQVELSADSRLLATDFSGDVNLYDTTTRRLVRTVVKQGRGAGIANPATAFSPDGSILATNNNYACAQLWSTATGELVATIGASKAPVAVRSMAFSPDGATLATGHSDGTLELWDSKTGALLDKYRVGDPVDSLAFSRDGTMLAVGDNEGIERLYDPATMRLLTPSMPVGEDGTFGVNRNDKAIASAVFSPDGATLATTDRDGTLRLWNTSSGASVGTMITPADGLAVLAAFSSDGRTLYSGSDGGQLESWPVAMFADPVAALCSAVGPPTQLDWTEYAPGQPFPAVCGGSP